MPTKINLTFLGTSAQVPSAKRNHPAMLLNFNEENILIDCGEGTQRQFRKAKISPAKITRILITHLHSDHVLGLIGLLSTLSLEGYNKTIYIYGPKGINEFMNSLLKLFVFKKNYEIKVQEVSGKFFENKNFYLSCEKMEHVVPANAYTFVKKGQIRIDKNKLKKFGIISGPLLQKLKEGKNIVYEKKNYKAKDLTFKEADLKISFVMDTLNNPKIVPFVKNSDILICESCFGEELKSTAKLHHHLTAKQAGQIAKKSKSKKLILTHISQRYEDNLDFILNQAKKEFKNVFVAKDLDVFEI